MSMDATSPNGTLNKEKASIYAGFRTSVDCLEYVIGGAERDRTADLLVANEALSQLSYSPHRTGNAPTEGLLAESSATHGTASKLPQ